GPPVGPAGRGHARDDPDRRSPRRPAGGVPVGRRRAVRRSDGFRFVVVVVALVALHFSVRSRLGDDRIAPDFLLVAMLIYAMRAQPGPSAGVGFLVGLLRDALSPASFGAQALAQKIGRAHV